MSKGTSRMIALLSSIVIAILFLRGYPGFMEERERSIPSVGEQLTEISGTVQRGETLFGIFKKYGLDPREIFRLGEASAHIHRIEKVHPGRLYKIQVDDNYQVSSFTYSIDDESLLCITRNESGFCAERKPIEYEKRILHLGGVIDDNLISSIGEGRENQMLALDLSDIFSWDIDFTTDLRDGDTFKIVVEGLYLNGELKRYGNILSAEFMNDGGTYCAYRFAPNGKADYYDAEGNSLRKSFLRAPLSFRRISSMFTNKRFHPILKISRPHHGLDYAASTGTPVSASGDGTVVFAGRRGQYGKLIIIRHRNGYKTSYGHLSQIRGGVRRGTKVEQGQVIGYVGATGLATGPHLHYEMRVYNKPVDPLNLKTPRGEPVPHEFMANFREFKRDMDTRFASIRPREFVLAYAKESNSETRQEF